MKTKMMMVVVLICIAATGALAERETTVQELVPLSHPIKYVMANEKELNISAEQMVRLKKDMVAVFPPQILPMVIEAEAMEASLLEAIMGDGKSKEVLAGQIEEIVELKRRLLNKHIDSLNTLKDILTDEQWLAMRVLIAEDNGVSDK